MGLTPHPSDSQSAGDDRLHVHTDEWLSNDGQQHVETTTHRALDEIYELDITDSHTDGPMRWVLCRYDPVQEASFRIADGSAATIEEAETAATKAWQADVAMWKERFQQYADGIPTIIL